MLKDVGEALGPWPILQFFFGFIVLVVGAIVVLKGISGKGKDDRVQLEDRRQEWEAYQQLEQIRDNTKQIADNQRAMLEGVRSAVHEIRELTTQMKALAAAIWNRGV